MTKNTHHLIEISKFLKNTSFFWETEMIKQDLESLPDEYISWAKVFQKKSNQDKAHIYNFGQYEEIKQLTNFPKTSQVSSIKPIRFIKDKKRHELAQIHQLIYKLTKDDNSLPFHLIDFCGGMGHLPISLERAKFNFQSLTLDYDPKLIEKGQKLTCDTPHIYFQQIDLKKQKYRAKTTDQNIAVGLHTCGDLAHSVLDSDCKELLNWGCCYHKVSNQYTPLSQIGQKRLPQLTNHALTLAAKCHKEITQQGIQRRYKVKRFRYALELIFCNFKDTGSLLPDAYSKDFAHYLNAINFQTQMSLEQIQASFEEHLEIIDKYIALGFLRDHWGRVIESAVILDRACYLEEKGYEVKIEETFDRKISPRNLMIYAQA